jgi:hypothetical protein
MFNLKVNVLVGRTSIVPLVRFNSRACKVRELDKQREDAYLMSHFFVGVRVYDSLSFEALAHAVKLGVFGRGSVARFHLSAYATNDTTYVFPLFAENKTGVLVPNTFGFEQYMITAATDSLDSVLSKHESQW